MEMLHLLIHFLQSLLHLKHMLRDATDAVNRLWPIYSHMPSHLSKLAFSVTPGVQQEDVIIKEMRVKNASTMGHHYAPYRKALELLNMVVSYSYVHQCKCYQTQQSFAYCYVFSGLNYSLRLYDIDVVYREV
jgi:hypothetical protein